MGLSENGVPRQFDRISQFIIIVQYFSNKKVAIFVFFFYLKTCRVEKFCFEKMVPKNTDHPPEREGFRSWSDSNWLFSNVYVMDGYVISVCEYI